MSQGGYTTSFEMMGRLKTDNILALMLISTSISHSISTVPASVPASKKGIDNDMRRFCATRLNIKAI
jgi:hypothetical protein